MSRWITSAGYHSAELAELILRARTGEPWADIAAIFYPHRKNAVRRACDIFKVYASEIDRAERREALARRGFNRLGKGGWHRKQDEGEPAVQPETQDLWAGMGECFATPRLAA